MNAINLIFPYRYEGMWVFDDARVGLDKEPFVSGADTMIDVLVNPFVRMLSIFFVTLRRVWLS